MNHYAEVSFRQQAFGMESFTFLIPETLENRIQVGQIVEVPFRNIVKKGLVINITKEKPAFETKPISKPLTPPLLTAKELEIARRIAKSAWCPLSKALALLLPEKIWLSDGLPPVRVFLQLATPPAPETAKKPVIKGKKQLAVLDYLRTSGASDIRLVQAETGASSAVFRTLLEKNLIQKVFREKFPAKTLPKIPLTPLNDSQKAAHEIIKKHPQTLLTGKTGSGKSFLLRQIAAEALNEGKTVLYLVPEIALTFEALRKAQEAYGKDNIAVFHSRLSEGEKAALWWRVKTGEAKIVFGSRSALFLPFPALDLIIIEEEHDSSYKNDQAPRYHAHKVAEILRETYQAKVVLTGATPSLETFHRATEGAISLAKLSAEQKDEREIEIVDMRDELLSANPSPLSRLLKKQIGETLTQGKKVLLFLNRRGFHSTLFCRECGNALRCNFCHITLTHHRKGAKEYLLCHHCGRITLAPPRCLACGSPRLTFFGAGTQKIEDLVKTEFPEAKVLRADRDSTQKKADFQNILREFFDGEGQILVGTQIIGKGFDSAEIGLVGVILADTSLQIPDFRAREKTFQLLTQAIGRVRHKGHIVIQTFLPQNDVIQKIAAGDYENFYTHELAEREKLALPPFRRIAKLMFVHHIKEKAFAAARKAEARLKKLLTENEEVFLAPALIPFKHGKYHINVFLYSPAPEALLSKINLTEARVDIDPVDTV